MEQKVNLSERFEHFERIMLCPACEFGSLQYLPWPGEEETLKCSWCSRRWYYFENESKKIYRQAQPPRFANETIELEVG